MSSGVLLQLAAYGAQDIILMGNPQTSHFRSVYKRHTNFTMQDILQTFEGIPKLGTLNPIKINKTGDMISDMSLDLTLELTIPQKSEQYVSLPPNLGHALIEYIEFKIGGLTIDKHYFDWFNIYHELINDNNHNNAYDTLINSKKHHTLINGNGTTFQKSKIQLYIPLYFWFCRYKNCALPIVALQYQDIILNIKFRESKYLVNHAYIGTNSFTPTLQLVETDLSGLLCKYIFLDREERKYFASNEAEYLIEQVQSNLNNSVISSNSKTTTDLTFNHPVKSLFWVIKQNHHINKEHDFNYLGKINHKSYEVDLIQLKQHILHYWVVFTPTPNKIYYPVIISNVINWQDTQATYSPTTATTKFNSNLVLDNNLTKLNEIISIFSNELKNNIILLSQNNDKTSYTHNNLIINNNWSHSSMLILSKILSSSKSEIQNEGIDINNLYEFLTNSPSNSNLFTKQIIMDNSIYSISPNINENPSSKARITMNGLTRTENHRGDYYNYIQPLNHKCNTPKCGVNMYSFSLNPFEFQPSGTCNFSRLDRIVLEVTHNSSLKNGILNIFALNYNVIKFKNGLCSLAYTS